MKITSLNETILETKQPITFCYKLANSSSLLSESSLAIVRPTHNIEISSSRNLSSSIKIEDDFFNNSLMVLDSALPQILGHLIFLAYKTKEQSIKKTTMMLEKDNPLKYNTSPQQKFYVYKIKKFLREVLCGFTLEQTENKQSSNNEMLFSFLKKKREQAHLTFDLNEIEDELFKHASLDITTLEEVRHVRNNITNEYINLTLKI